MRLLSMMNFSPKIFLDSIAPLMKVFNFVATCSRNQIEIYGSWAKLHGHTFDLHVWHKPDAMPFTNGTFKSDFEYIVLIYSDGRPFTNKLPHEFYSKLFSHCTVKGRDEHPTVKPLSLMRKYVQVLAPVGGVVFDPFMGSGTTGVAALQLGRRFIGCELDPGYFAIAQRRIENAAAQPLLIPPAPAPAAAQLGL